VFLLWVMRHINAKEAVMPRVGVKALGLCVLVAFPSMAFANAGVPMIFLVMPVMALSILPIIAIETFFYARNLALSVGEAGKVVTIGNLVSTVIGIPLAWGAMVLLQIVTGGSGAYGISSFGEKFLAVTWQSAWLIPYEAELGWMIPVAGLVLLIPFFLVSWWSEYQVARRMLRGVEVKRLNETVRNANLITYGLLTLWPIGMLVVPSI
jgi:hypothetical protein